MLAISQILANPNFIFRLQEIIRDCEKDHYRKTVSFRIKPRLVYMAAHNVTKNIESHQWRRAGTWSRGNGNVHFRWWWLDRREVRSSSQGRCWRRRKPSPARSRGQRSTASLWCHERFRARLRIETLSFVLAIYRPVATGGIRGQCCPKFLLCSPNFVAPRKICFKHTIKAKIVLP